VAQGDQVRCPLGGHDPGDPGRVEGVSLRERFLPQELDGLWGHLDAATGRGGSPYHRLLPHVYHAGRALLIQVRKLRHPYASDPIPPARKHPGSSPKSTRPHEDHQTLRNLFYARWRG
jgi:hypothetical protein